MRANPRQRFRAIGIHDDDTRDGPGDDGDVLVCGEPCAQLVLGRPSRLVFLPCDDGTLPSPGDPGSDRDAASTGSRRAAAPQVEGDVEDVMRHLRARGPPRRLRSRPVARRRALIEQPRSGAASSDIGREGTGLLANLVVGQLADDTTRSAH